MGQTLVAFDDSEFSYKALDKAMSLAHEDDELIILYVIPAALIKEFEDFDSEVSRSKAQEIVNKGVNKAKARGLKVIGVVKEGDIAETIIDFANTMQCSLIVMGSKGVSKIGRFALGSVADKVTRHSDKPVLIVR